jgi:hypothetical protein
MYRIQSDISLTRTRATDLAHVTTAHPGGEHPIPQVCCHNSGSVSLRNVQLTTTVVAVCVAAVIVGGCQIARLHVVALCTPGRPPRLSTTRSGIVNISQLLSSSARA